MCWQKVFRATRSQIHINNNALRIRVQTHLLLILPLEVQPGLDVPSGLLEGLSLGHLSGVVGADTDDVGAQEDQDVGAHLGGTREEGRWSSLRYQE